MALLALGRMPPGEALLSANELRNVQNYSEPFKTTARDLANHGASALGRHRKDISHGPRRRRSLGFQLEWRCNLVAARCVVRLWRGWRQPNSRAEASRYAS